MIKQFKQWLIENATEVVYHGTQSNFKDFSSAYTIGQMGIHFGTFEQAKNIISDNYDEPIPGSRIIEAQLTINNPLELEDLGSWYGEDVVNMVNKVLGTKLNPSASDRSIRGEIINKGYDGVTYQNKFEGDGRAYIVFNQNQIKVLNIQQF